MFWFDWKEYLSQANKGDLPCLGLIDDSWQELREKVNSLKQTWLPGKSSLGAGCSWELSLNICNESEKKVWFIVECFYFHANFHWILVKFRWLLKHFLTPWKMEMLHLYGRAIYQGSTFWCVVHCDKISTKTFVDHHQPVLAKVISGMPDILSGRFILRQYIPNLPSIVSIS